MRFRVPRNLGWKIGSLALAVLLWAAMSVEPEVVVVRDAPVLYKNVPPNRMLNGEAPQSVRLELKGRPAELTTETLSGISVVIDVDIDVNKDTGTVPVAATHLNLPRGVSLLRATPPQIQVALTQLSNKQVPVEIQFFGSPGSGKQVLSAHLAPESLTMAGAESDLAAVSKVLLTPIDLSTITSSDQLKVRALVPQPRLYFTSSPMVTVTIALGPGTNRPTQNQKEIR